MRAVARSAWPPGWEKMNRLEKDWSQVLTGDAAVTSWRFEALKLRLATGAYYTPDFFVVTEDGLVELHETKGHMREAARVRLLTAADLYPEFEFKLIRRSKGGQSWEIAVITGAGKKR